MKPTILCAAALGLSLAATSFGEPLWISSSNAILRAGHAAVYKPLVNLAKGMQVNGLAHEAGWVQIDTGSAQGWVSEASVSTSKVSADANLRADASMSAGAAARGLNPDAEQYVAARNINKAPLESLRQMARDVQSNPDEWIAFTRDVHK